MDVKNVFTNDVRTAQEFSELTDFFKKIKLKEVKVPKTVTSALNVLSTDKTPKDMKLIFALSELSTYVSQFNFKIRLDRKTKVTTNLFVFLFSGSGNSKNKSVNSIRNCLMKEYNYLKSDINTKLISKAKAECTAVNGNEKKWRDFYKGSIETLFPTLSTPEGMLHQMSKLDKIGYGAFTMNVDELGTELKSSGDAMITNLKNQASGYDLGKISSKLVKTDTLQTTEIKSLNINTLMFSSIHTLMKEKSVRDTFIDTFTTQFARRSLFYMDSSKVDPISVKSINDLVESLRSADTTLDGATKDLEKKSATLYRKLSAMREKSEDITISEEVDEDTGYSARDIYNLYRVYSYNRSLLINRNFEMLQLSTAHAYWRVLKLAGLFSLLQAKSVITTDELLMSISVIEKFNIYIAKFQTTVNKEPYEQLAEYCLTQASVGKRIKVSKHKIIKEGIIPSNISDKKLEEMVILCNSSDDEDAVFKYQKGYVVVKVLESTTEPVGVEKVQTLEVQEESVLKPTVELNTDSITASYKPFKDKNGKWLTWDNPKESKDYRRKNAHNGYVAIADTKLKDKSFKIYEKLVKLDCCYSPYSFKDGHRLLDNINTLTDSIVIDVDNGTLTMEQVHSMLSSYKHVIASTSDVTNEFKYRIILQLDRQVDLTPPQWRVFYRSISNLFAIPADPQINKASMFFGFSSAKVLTNFEGKLLATKQHLLDAYETTTIVEEVVPAKTQKQLDILWDQRFENKRFKVAYEAFRMRRMKMYSAMRHAIDIGFTKGMITDLIEEINSELHQSVPYRVVRAEILSQVERLYQQHSPNKN